MSRNKKSTLAGLIDSDSEDDQLLDGNMSKSTTQNQIATKKLRGRPKVAPSKVTKTKAPARRTSGRLNAKTKANSPPPKRGKISALTDKTNQSANAETELPQIDDTDIVMEDAASGDELDDEVDATKQVKPTTAKGRAAARSNPPKKVTQRRTVVEENEIHVAKVGRPARKGKGKVQIQPAPQLESSPVKIVQETQMEIEQAVEDEPDQEHSIPELDQTETRPLGNTRRRQPSIPHRRAGSVSDTERSDPAIRRRLGDLTKKLENVETKYQDLREISVKEAERTFDRFKKTSEEKTKSSNELIASLKTNLAAQSALAKESQNLKKTVESQDALVTNLQAQVNRLEKALSEAQAENKTLSAKLAANRKITASYESANVKIPGSAVKANGGMRMIGSAEAAQAAQAAQLKEDLYSDLTGLIIRGVKRESEEDIFDCIQTGRNGTLHFKLGVDNEKAAHGDADCRYTPLLDPSRDKPLLELLPDYLVDEIEFPRPQAAKFYARISRALTVKPASMGGPVDESDE